MGLRKIIENELRPLLEGESELTLNVTTDTLNVSVYIPVDIDIIDFKTLKVADRIHEIMIDANKNLNFFETAHKDGFVGFNVSYNL